MVLLKYLPPDCTTSNIILAVIGKWSDAGIGFGVWTSVFIFVDDDIQILQVKYHLDRHKF